MGTCARKGRQRWVTLRRYRFGKILYHAPALIIQDPEAVLGSSIALIGSKPVPLQGLGKVLRHAPAAPV